MSKQRRLSDDRQQALFETGNRQAPKPRVNPDGSKKTAKSPRVEVIRDEKPLSPVVNDCRTPLPELREFDELAFDTESTTEPSLFKRKIVGISYFLPDGRKDYVPIRHPGGGNYDEDIVKRWVKNEFVNKRLIGANSKYEVHMTRNWGVELEEQGCSMADVFHQAALLDEQRYKLNLSLLMQEEMPLHPRIEAEHAQIWRMSAAEAAAIAIEDAEVAYKLDKIYEPKIEKEELNRVLNLENDLVFATVEMERNGVYLDIPKMIKWQAEVKIEIEQRLKAIADDVGFQIETGSWKSMQKMFDHLKIEYPRTAASTTHPDGCPSFTDEFLQKVCGRHTAVNLASEARQLASYKSKFLDAYIERVGNDGRIFYSLHQLRGDEGGTITGRYSSSQSKDGEGINAQQVAEKSKQPELLQRWDIRELFLPETGKRWCSADAAQIELRFLVHYAAVNGWNRLADAYKKDPWIDFHMLMVDWTGLPRPFAKNVTFAKQYGAGPDKIAYMCKVSRAEGKKISDQYDAKFGEAKRLLKMASDQAESIGYVRTLLGRRRRFRPGDRFYTAWNAIVQGGAADINKLKVLELYRNRKRLNLTLRVTVHDEADGDVPNTDAMISVKNLLNDQSIPMKVPILWKCGEGANLQIHSGIGSW